MSTLGAWTKQRHRTHAGTKQQASLPHVPVKRTLTSRAPPRPRSGQTDERANYLAQNDQRTLKEWAPPVLEFTGQKWAYVCVLKWRLLKTLIPWSEFRESVNCHLSPNIIVTSLSWGLIVLTVKWPEVSPWPFHSYCTALRYRRPRHWTRNKTSHTERRRHPHIPLVYFTPYRH